MTYKLFRDRDTGKYTILGNDDVISTGTQEEIIKKLLLLHFSESEIEYAILDLCQKDNQIAHFGINKLFMFSV